MVFFLLIFAGSSPNFWAQAQVSGEGARKHNRIERTEVPGRRIELESLKGARMFAGPSVNVKKKVPLVVHFHGAPWLIEYHAASKLPRAVVITVQLGAGSRVYGRPFEDAAAFRALIEEARSKLGGKGWSSVTLTGFSAGYGAVRAILRDENNFALVDNVLLFDGIHAGYVPEGGQLNAADLDSFVKFAREAAKGKKGFVITHSEIVPPNYAGTTECTDHLLSVLGVARRLKPGDGPMGMRQRNEAVRGRLIVLGYAGDSAPDHIDHLHAMGEWLRLLKIK